MNKCPYCKEDLRITWNWVKDKSTGKWIHECWTCGSVFMTDKKVKEDKK